MDIKVRSAIKKMSDMDLCILQHETAKSNDPSDIQFRKEILIELGLRSKKSQNNN